MLALFLLVTCVSGAVTWSALPNYPIALSRPVTVSAWNQLYVIGGADATAWAYPNVYSYSEGSTSWTAAPNLNLARYAAAGAFANGKIYVFGGQTTPSGAITNTVEAFDGCSWTTLPSSQNLPSTLWHHGAVAYGTKIYIFGGYTDSSSTFATSFYIFDTTTGTYSTYTYSYPAADMAVAAVTTVTVQHSWFLLAAGGVAPAPTYYSTKIYALDVGQAVTTWQVGPRDIAGFNDQLAHTSGNPIASGNGAIVGYPLQPQNTSQYWDIYYVGGGNSSSCSGASYHYESSTDNWNSIHPSGAAMPNYPVNGGLGIRDAGYALLNCSGYFYMVGGTYGGSTCATSYTNAAYRILLTSDLNTFGTCTPNTPTSCSGTSSTSSSAASSSSSASSSSASSSSASSSSASSSSASSSSASSSSASSSSASSSSASSSSASSSSTHSSSASSSSTSTSSSSASSSSTSASSASSSSASSSSSGGIKPDSSNTATKSQLGSAFIYLVLGLALVF